METIGIKVKSLHCVDRKLTWRPRDNTEFSRSGVVKVSITTATKNSVGRTYVARSTAQSRLAPYAFHVLRRESWFLKIKR